MILINTRPKDLSEKINELCDQEKIELQNIYLSKIIPIEIDTDNGVYKEIFENLDNLTKYNLNISSVLNDINFKLQNV